MQVITNPSATAERESVIATDISLDTYFEQYASAFCEWEAGRVIQWTPVHERHDEVTIYLRTLLQAYLELQPLGKIRNAPFTMKIEGVGTVREPDIQVILGDNPHYTPTGMKGPANICIEVVSLESVARDYGIKFEEYQTGQVPEYWIIDPTRRDARFYRLDDEGVFQPYREDAKGNYQTPQLPYFQLQVTTLWQSPPPTLALILQAVRDRFEDE